MADGTQRLEGRRITSTIRLDATYLLDPKDVDSVVCSIYQHAKPLFEQAKARGNDIQTLEVNLEGVRMFSMLHMFIMYLLTRRQASGLVQHVHVKVRLAEDGGDNYTIAQNLLSLYKGLFVSESEEWITFSVFDHVSARYVNTSKPAAHRKFVFTNECKRLIFANVPGVAAVAADQGSPTIRLQDSENIVETIRGYLEHESGTRKVSESEYNIQFSQRQRNGVDATHPLYYVELELHQQFVGLGPWYQITLTNAYMHRDDLRMIFRGVQHLERVLILRGGLKERDFDFSPFRVEEALTNPKREINCTIGHLHIKHSYQDPRIKDKESFAGHLSTKYCWENIVTGNDIRCFSFKESSSGMEESSFMRYRALFGLFHDLRVKYEKLIQERNIPQKNLAVHLGVYTARHMHTENGATINNAYVEYTNLLKTMGIPSDRPASDDLFTFHQADWSDADWMNA